MSCQLKQEEAAKLSADLAAREDKLALFKQDLSQAQKLVKTKGVEVQRLQDDIKTLKYELENARSESNHIQEELQSTAAELEERSEALEKAEQLKNHLQTELTEIQEQRMLPSAPLLCIRVGRPTFLNDFLFFPRFLISV